MKIKVKVDIKVGTYIDLDGINCLWESLQQDLQKEIGKALNDAALRAVGYLPVSDREEDNQIS